MIKPANKVQHFWLLTPLFGTILFVCLYIAATFFYPGGSQVDKYSKGFSWINNYWCNLLNETAINGQPNPARPIAMTATFVLCLTLAVFWYLFPREVKFEKSSRLLIQISGVVAMTIGMFLFTDLHDSIVNLASLSGLVATVGTLIGLYMLQWTRLFWSGIFNLALVGLNNLLYYAHGLKLYLPVVQKITFLFFLLWICLIDTNLFISRRLAKSSKLE